jgi:guanylate kinase
LEYAIVHGNYYGTSLQPVKQALNEGKLVIFDIDVQGHRLVRAKIGDLVTSVFITPPTLHELERRLYARSSENLEVIQRRIENAKGEIKAIGEFDFVIINDILDRASKQFAIIANASRLKLSKQELEKLLLHWENGSP